MSKRQQRIAEAKALPQAAINLRRMAERNEVRRRITFIAAGSLEPGQKVKTLSGRVLEGSKGGVVRVVG
jgi:hypothetical protein